MVIPQVQFGSVGDASFAAQTAPNHQPHYDLVMSADDAVCKPLLDLYNKMLSEAIAALRSHPSTAPFTSDFEVLQPESFKAIDFRLPPIEMGGADVGIYRADVFNDGEPRPVIMGISYNGRTMGAYTVVLKIVADNSFFVELLERASYEPLTTAWLQHSGMLEASPEFTDWSVPQKYEKYGLPKGYLLTKWPHLDNLVERWVHRGHRSSPFLPILAYHTTTRIFLGVNRTFFVTNEYVDIRYLKYADSIISIYTMSRDGPLDVCYLHMNPMA
jgi:hypothetical protein